jgi:hypothetical protein
MTTVTGRVRPTVRLRQTDVDAACVLATSWSSDRPFPRTAGVGLPFEIETATGEVFRVDPFNALVALPVRRRERAGGVRREYSWVAPADEVVVEGEIDRDGPSRLPPALHACRIDLRAPDGAAHHRVPPRALVPGEADDGSVSAAPPPNGEPPHPPPPRRKRKAV